MSKKILLVEDTIDIRSALRLLLEMRGYTVIEAGDGLEALELAVKHLPDLILMDLAMPVHDGVAATRAIRAEKSTSLIPIIAVSSHEGSMKTSAIIAGCNEVMTKSAFMAAFDSTLAKYLPLSVPSDNS
ncbi:MAG: response regulator [Pyrinomonadaceae bacterium]